MHERERDDQRQQHGGQRRPEPLHQQGDAQHRREEQRQQQPGHGDEPADVNSDPRCRHRCSCRSTGSSSRGRRRRRRRRSRAIATRHTHFSKPAGCAAAVDDERAQRERQEHREPDLPVGDVDDVRVRPVEQRRQQVRRRAPPTPPSAAARGPPCRRRCGTGPARAAAPPPGPPTPSPRRSRPICRSCPIHHVSSSARRGGPRASPAGGSGRQPGVGLVLHPEVDARGRPAAVLSTVERRTSTPAGVTRWLPAAARWRWAPPSWPRSAPTAGSRRRAGGARRRCCWSSADSCPLVAVPLLRPRALIADPADRHRDGRGGDADPLLHPRDLQPRPLPAGCRRGLIALVLTLALVFADFGSRPAATTTGPTSSSSCRWRIPPYVFGRISRRLAEQSELLAAPAGADPRPGGARRAGPDRARAARRDRPLGQRDGGADGGGAGPAAQPAGPGRRAARRPSPTPAGRPSRRPAGCCT